MATIPVRSRAMKIGVMLAGVNTKFWTAAAQAAEDAGFESVWLPEHLVFPVAMQGSPHAGESHPPIPPQTPAFDALMSLAAIAAVTEKVRLGTNVYNIGLRHPFVTARAIATLDVISQGRVEFGIGASWLEEEWEVTGLDFHTRGRRVDETIDICRRLWTEDEVEHHGEFFDFAPVMFNPKPVQQPQPSLLIGGDGAAAKRRAALVGDGWLPMNHTLEQLPAALAEINEQRAAAGRDGATALTISGSIESLADVERYRDAGVDRVCVRPFTSSREALDGIARFGDDILTRL
jgi:probable F420-dependent oxidoreductase